MACNDKFGKKRFSKRACADSSLLLGIKKQITPKRAVNCFDDVTIFKPAAERIVHDGLGDLKQPVK